ncbi:MAG: TIGR01212 family radical SAM protein [bacterium]
MENLPYNSLRKYYAEKYTQRVQKITVSLPFTCPHMAQDGTGGCTYCHQGSIPNLNDSKLPMQQQVITGITAAQKRYGLNTKYIIYFQTHTNTNATIATLKKIYDEALGFENVIGLGIGTRPDCVDNDVLNLLNQYCDSGHEVWIELGLQSANNATLKIINRGHTVEDFIDAVLRAKKTKLKITAHMIIGLPGEKKEDFMKTAKLIASLGVHAIKIHPLHVMEGTVLGDNYKKQQFETLHLDDYIEALADIIEILPPDMIVMRYTAEAIDSHLLAPNYCRPEYKIVLKQMLIAELLKRESKQGSKL